MKNIKTFLDKFVLTPNQMIVIDSLILRINQNKNIFTCNDSCFIIDFSLNQSNRDNQ